MKVNFTFAKSSMKKERKAICGHFLDYYNYSCVIRENSINKESIYLGKSKGGDGIELGKEQASMLIKMLTQFIATGRILEETEYVYGDGDGMIERRQS